MLEDTRCIRRYRLKAIAIFGLVVIGLADVSAALAQDDDADPALFYPALPDPPRLQYLTKFASALDVGGKSGGFRDFLFGGEDAEAHLVSKPYGLAVYEGAIYVVDSRGGGYGVYDVANKRVRKVQPEGAGKMQKPINIAIDADGTRYVTDTSREQVLVFDRNDRFVRAFGRKDQFIPVDVIVAGDRLYITDILNHQVHALDKRTGEVITTFAESGSGEGQLFHPTNLAVGPDGSIFVADTTNFRVQVFSPDGDMIRQIGQAGMSVGNFARPKGIAVSRDGHLYVVDSAFQNVQIFDSDGTPLMFFGEPGNGPGNINLPTVVKIDYDNVDHFRQFSHPDFEIEYLVLVASQFGPNKVVVYGFGTMSE